MREVVGCVRQPMRSVSQCDQWWVWREVVCHLTDSHFNWLVESEGRMSGRGKGGKSWAKARTRLAQAGLQFSVGRA